MGPFHNHTESFIFTPVWRDSGYPHLVRFGVLFFLLPGTQESRQDELLCKRSDSTNEDEFSFCDNVGLGSPLYKPKGQTFPAYSPLGSSCMCTA